MEHYLLIHKSILPAYYEKVLKVRRLLESGQEKEVSQAARAVGISRSTYYKYKDFILEPSEGKVGRKAVFSLMLAHEAGVLSSVLSRISEKGGSVLTITQSLPIRGQASVTLSLDVGELKLATAELLEELKQLDGVEQAKLVAVE